MCLPGQSGGDFIKCHNHGLLIRVISVEKQEIYRCMSLTTANLKDECWQSYSIMLKKLREQAADLTGHRQMGRLQFTLTVRNFLTKKAYKIPNEVGVGLLLHAQILKTMLTLSMDGLMMMVTINLPRDMMTTFQ